MLNWLKWRIRTWEQAGAYPAVTRAATFAWLQMHNLHDRVTMGRTARALAGGHLAATPDVAVQQVCEGPFGAAIRPMQVPQELAGLIALVQEQQPRALLEVGTARGGTLLLLCRFAAPDATIVSVDLPYARNGGGYPHWKKSFYTLFPLPGQSLHLVQANSHAPETRDKVSALVGARGLDFVLIDADHSYEGVKQDFENYRPLMAPGGIIAFHDVLPNDTDPSIDVYRFWQELEADPAFETQQIVHDPQQGHCGIGVVRL